MLNQDQQNAFDRMTDYVNGPADEPFLLEGFAGTGKTYTISHFIKSLLERSESIKFVMTAPTNKAVHVLKSYVSRQGISAECLTTFKLLGLKLSKNSAELVPEPGGSSSIGDYDVVIVDECSMLSSQLYNFLMHEARDKQKHVIFMGDRLQLPPVGEELSLAFQIENRATLNQVVRQAEGNPIINLTREIRHAIEHGGEFSINPAVSKCGRLGVHKIPMNLWVDWMRGAFTSDDYKDDQDRFRILAWTNEAVNQFNANVRQFIYGNDAWIQPFMPGERIITRKPAFGEAGKFGQIIIDTNDEVIVEAVEKSVHPYFKAGRYEGNRFMRDIEIPVLKLKVRELSGISHTLYVPHGTGVRIYQDEVARLKREAMDPSSSVNWGQYYFFQQGFADVAPCHAITTHRSQGSTYRHVFIDAEDILRNKNRIEALKCLYVAVSRASENVIFCG